MTYAEAAAFVEDLATMLEDKRARYIVLPMEVARALLTPPSEPAAGCSESASRPPQTPPT